MSVVLISAGVLAVVIQLSLGTDVRGVNPSKEQYYQSRKDFTCLDGSITIPFSLVNDDYCDCRYILEGIGFTFITIV